MITQLDEEVPPPTNPNDAAVRQLTFAWDDVGRPTTLLDHFLPDERHEETLSLETYIYADGTATLPSRVDQDFGNDGSVDRSARYVLSDAGEIVRVEEDFDGDGGLNAVTDVRDDCCFCGI